MQHWFRILIPAAVAFLAGAPVAHAGEQPPIQFKPRMSSTRIEGRVARGDRDIYPISARAGQLLTVLVAAGDDDAAVTIYAPGARASKGADGVWKFEGRAIAGGTSGITKWSGTLSQSGRYLIVVGGTDGRAEYKLTVAVQ
jgi:hypothetical protein